jgi:hypothetical protein
MGWRLERLHEFPALKARFGEIYTLDIPKFVGGGAFRKSKFALICSKLLRGRALVLYHEFTKPVTAELLAHLFFRPIRSLVQTLTAFSEG